MTFSLTRLWKSFCKEHWIGSRWWGLPQIRPSIHILMVLFISVLAPFAIYLQVFSFSQHCLFNPKLYNVCPIYLNICLVCWQCLCQGEGSCFQMITPLWKMISQRGWRGLPGNQSHKILTFQWSPSVCLYSAGGLFFCNSLRAPFVICTCMYIPLRRMHSQGHERRSLFGLSSIGKRWNFWRLVHPIFLEKLPLEETSNVFQLKKLPSPGPVGSSASGWAMQKPRSGSVSNLRQRHATWSELCCFSFGPMSCIFVMPNSNPKSWGTVHLEGTRESLWLHEPLTKHRAHGSHFPCSMHDTKRRILWTEQGSLCYRTGFFSVGELVPMVCFYEKVSGSIRLLCS